MLLSAYSLLLPCELIIAKCSGHPLAVKRAARRISR